MDIIDTISRYLHILSAITILGGIIAVNMVILPTLKKYPADMQESFKDAAQKKFMMLVHPAILFLILTGAWQWYQNVEMYRATKMSQGVLGMKVLIALVMFALVFIQATGAVKRETAVKINLYLGLLVVLLAAIVRLMRLDVLTIAGG